MRALTFFPYFAIWDWRFQESLFEKSLIEKKIQTDTIVCNGEFKSHCLAVISHKIKNISSDAVCKKCIKNRDFFLNKHNLNIINIIKCEKIKKITKNLNFKNILNFKFKNIDVGKFVFYDLCILKKKNNFKIDNLDEYNICKNAIISCIHIINTLNFLNKKYFLNHNLTFTTNGMYSVHNSFNSFIKRNFLKTKLYSVQNSLNPIYRDTDFHVFKYNNFIGIKDLINKFNKKKIKISLYKLNKVIKYLYAVATKATHHLYSSPLKRGSDNNFNKKLFIKKNYNILLLTLSSPDELIPILKLDLLKNLNIKNKNPYNFFNNEYDWIKFAIDIVKKRNDTILVIRPHPRTYNDEKKKKIISLIDNNPNIRLDSPDKKISIFEYANKSKLVLNAWSSAGEDLGLCGLPVITLSKIFSNYPVNLGHYCESKIKYYNLINKILSEPKKNFCTSIDNFLKYKCYIFSDSTYSITRNPNIYLILLKFCKFLDNYFFNSKEDFSKKKILSYFYNATYISKQFTINNNFIKKNYLYKYEKNLDNQKFVKLHKILIIKKILKNNSTNNSKTLNY